MRAFVRNVVLSAGLLWFATPVHAQTYPAKPITIVIGYTPGAVSAIQVAAMAENPDALSRVIQGIIQGVMAGISFIGAGVILRDPGARTVEGLTTAATVWVAAALGIACGLAAWTTIAVGAALALLLLAGVGWLEAVLGMHDRKGL